MADFVSLTCPTCNGKLQITPNLERFACAYCGNEFAVNRGGGIVTLSPVVEGLSRVERGVDKTASELAIARLQNDLAPLNAQRAEINSQAGAGPYVAACVLLAFTFLAVVNDQLLAAALGAFVAGLFFLVGYSSASTAKKKRAALDQQIAVITDEIDQHMAIVAR